MASVRRFGSCSSCRLRNSRQNGNGRSWKCRSVVPEWLLGSRIKAQGEEEDDGKRETAAAKAKAASQAGGVGPLCVAVSVCLTFLDIFQLSSVFFLTKLISSMSSFLFSVCAHVWTFGCPIRG